MSKADIQCWNCGHEWTYSGLSADTAYCPRCSDLNQLKRSNVQIIKEFGFHDRHGMPV